MQSILLASLNSLSKDKLSIFVSWSHFNKCSDTAEAFASLFIQSFKCSLKRVSIRRTYIWNYIRLGITSYLIKPWLMQTVYSVNKIPYVDWGCYYFDALFRNLISGIDRPQYFGYFKAIFHANPFYALVFFFW